MKSKNEKKIDGIISNLQKFSEANRNLEFLVINSLSRNEFVIKFKTTIGIEAKGLDDAIKTANNFDSLLKTVLSLKPKSKTK